MGEQTLSYDEITIHLDALFGDFNLISVEGQTTHAEKLLDTAAGIDALLLAPETPGPPSLYGVAIRRQHDYGGVETFTLRARTERREGWTELDKLANRYFNLDRIGPRFHLHAYYQDLDDPTSLLRFAIAETSQLMSAYIDGRHYTQQSTTGAVFVVINWADVDNVAIWTRPRGWHHLEDSTAT